MGRTKVSVDLSRKRIINSIENSGHNIPDIRICIFALKMHETTLYLFKKQCAITVIHCNNEFKIKTFISGYSAARFKHWGKFVPLFRYWLLLIHYENHLDRRTEKSHLMDIKDKNVRYEDSPVQSIDFERLEQVSELRNYIRYPQLITSPGSLVGVLF